MYAVRYNGGHPQNPESLTCRLHEYLSWLEVRGYSLNTIHGRDRYTGLFIDWCADRGLIVPHDITKPILERYQRYLFYKRKENGEPIGYHSQHISLVSVRAFFKWLSTYNYILYNPAADLVMPRKKHRLPVHVISEEDMETVMVQPDVTKAHGIRDRAVLETLYSTGLRRAELANLKLFDVDLDRRRVAVHDGKGGRDRIVPIGKRACQWVEKYLNEVRPKYVMMPDEHYLFLSKVGNPLNLNAVSQIARLALKGARINCYGAAHLFRHAMATHMLNNGADVRFIQAMLGHVELKSTEIYTRVAIQKLCSVHDATHPASPDRVLDDAVLETIED